MTTTKMAVVGLLAVSLTLSVGTAGYLTKSGASGGTARGGTIVSPSMYANAEAPTYSGQNDGIPETIRVQMILHSTEFEALPSGGALLTKISWRPDAIVPVGETIGYGQLRIALSVTPVDPLSMSSTFSDNIAGEQVVVYDGPWSGTVINADPPGPETRPFDYEIEFDTPYFYDPADGNLLSDWIMLNPSDPQPRIDTHAGIATEGQANRAGGINSSTTGGGSFVVVNQWTFIPEPSSSNVAAVLLIPLGLAIAMRWRRNRY